MLVTCLGDELRLVVVGSSLGQRLWIEQFPQTE
jgi:hypothetical protein